MHEVRVVCAALDQRDQVQHAVSLAQRGVCGNTTAASGSHGGEAHRIKPTNRT